MARDPTNRKDPLVQQLLGPDIDSPDLIQSRAFTDTLCVPEHQELLSKLHIFSTSQAKACLSNITLGVTGDSYMMQFFIELAEILYGTPTNGGITNGTYRHRLLRKTAEVSLEAPEGLAKKRMKHLMVLIGSATNPRARFRVSGSALDLFGPMFRQETAILEGLFGLRAAL